MDLLRIFAGWLLPWLLGIAIVRRAYARWPTVPPPHWAWLIGCGFFAGAFVLTLEMRGVSRLGVPFGLASVGAPLLVAAVLLWLPELRGLSRRGVPPRPALALSGGTAVRVAFYVLLAWLGVRALLLLLEVLRTPLYPWDAWTQWGTKAKVWYALRHMAPFAPFDAWLGAPIGTYFDAAPHYPATIPLWQVWSCLALGRWDDALMNLPWWLAGVALAFALYGFLRAQDFTPLFALIGTWIVTSMPILDTHVALAGYADLPLACYFAVGALAGITAVRTRSIAHACVALLLVAALPLIKLPGWIWLATLVLGLVVAAVPRYGMRIAVGAWVLGALLVLILGRFEVTLFNYQLHMQLQVPWHGLVEAYLSFANWHMLFWLLPAVLIVARRWVTAPEFAPLTAVIVSGVLFLLLGFSLSNAWIWVEDQSTVNRATLHLAPLLATWLVLLMQRALVAQPESGAYARAATTVEAPAAEVARVDA